MNPQAVEIWRAGVMAVSGYQSVATALNAQNPPVPDQIIAVGKAAGEMARAALDHFGAVPTLVVTKDQHATDLPQIARLIEASHPVPDSRSIVAGKALRGCVTDMGPNSRLLLLVSGGASSLAEDLVDGKSLADLQSLNARLLAEGLDITAMNAERRKVSQIKGGGLLGHFIGKAVCVLAISDVPGDDLEVIGSGIGAPPLAAAFDFEAHIVASNAIARNAAVRAAREMGYAVLANEETLHDDLTELAQTIGPRLANMDTGVIILGGEPTVVLPPSPGRGGRNQALALALAREVKNQPGLSVVVAGTDGSDGPTDAAGGIIDGTTWGADAAEALAKADSGPYLEARNALLKTGPTGTNVMDLLVALRD